MESVVAWKKPFDYQTPNDSSVKKARRPPGSLKRLKDDIYDLGHFIFKRDPNPTTTRYDRKRYLESQCVEALVTRARIMLRYLADMPCDCRSIYRDDSHKEFCVRIVALRFEGHFFERWGLTRYTEAGEVPEQIRRLGYEDPENADVIPLRRRPGGDAP